jgi:NAD dependent epimerase/dehydratase family enzyme
MTEKRILITGTDGLIGSHLKEHFLNEDMKYMEQLTLEIQKMKEKFEWIFQKMRNLLNYGLL